MLMRRYHNKEEEPKQEVATLPKYDELTKADIIKKLNEKDVPHSEWSTKKELYSLLRGD